VRDIWFLLLAMILPLGARHASRRYRLALKKVV
jgi:hypothetical protein